MQKNEKAASAKGKNAAAVAESPEEVQTEETQKQKNSQGEGRYLALINTPVMDILGIVVEISGGANEYTTLTHAVSVEKDWKSFIPIPAPITEVNPDQLFSMQQQIPNATIFMRTLIPMDSTHPFVERFKQFWSLTEKL